MSCFDLKVDKKTYSVEEKYGVVLPHTTLDLTPEQAECVDHLASVWPNLLVELYLSAHNGERLSFWDVLLKVKEVALDPYLGEEISLKQYQKLVAMPFDPTKKEDGWFFTYLMTGDSRIAERALGIKKAS